MARAALCVREADKQDVPTLLDMFEEVREAGPRRGGGGRSALAAQRGAIEDRYLAAIEDPEERLLVVMADGEILGMSLLSVGSASTVWDTPAVFMTHQLVATRHRRRGAGRALVAAAAAFAEEQGADGVAVTVYPHDRDVNRYYARLGFAPMAVRRWVSLPVLRRRLGGLEASHEGEVAARRRLRLRAPARGVPPP
ncbi:MAG: GNAT family N-acetyltransferase, partial [Mycobacteriales bacterium]